MIHYVVEDMECSHLKDNEIENMNKCVTYTF